MLWIIYRYDPDARRNCLLGRVRADNNPAAKLRAFVKFRIRTNIEQRRIGAEAVRAIPPAKRESLPSANNPHWITARRDSSCAGCRGAIRRGDRVFYDPANHTACGSRCGCAAETLCPYCHEPIGHGWGFDGRVATTGDDSLAHLTCRVEAIAA